MSLSTEICAKVLWSPLTILILSISAIGSGETLTLRMAEPQSTFSGKNIVLDVTMTNVSSRNLTIVKSNPGCDFQAEVKDSSGESVGLTSAGFELQACRRRISMGRWIIVTLKPGESTQESYPLDLYYGLEKAGRYTVRLSRELPREPGIGVVKSNEVTVILDE